ncbi:hypothetical protein LINGRAHAP2_LOCUS7704 [Linum grandiflorum]
MKYSCAPTSLGSRATPPRYVMEELNFLLGWLFRASNRLPDFVLTLEDGQGSLLPSHYTRCECSHSIVVGPECLCSRLKDYFG